MRRYQYFENVMRGLTIQHYVTPPHGEGMFGTDVRCGTCYMFPGAIFIPAGSEFATKETPDKRKYTHVQIGGKIDGVSIHVFDDIEPKAGEYLAGMLEVKLRLKEPTQGDSKHAPGENSVQNVDFYVNVLKTDKAPIGEVVINKTTTEDGTQILTDYLRKLDKDHVGDGHFAHHNYSKKYPRYQHIEIVLDERNEDRRPRRQSTTLGEAMQEAGFLGYKDEDGNSDDANDK